MKLTFGQLEATLAGHLRIHPDKIPTFRSRIKQLQRLQFPPGVNVGRGLKMEYSAEHLFMLVTAFELIGQALPAQTVCNIVTTHWEEFAAAYALAALQGRDFGPDKTGKTFAIVSIRSLYEIQFPIDNITRKASSVDICDLEATSRKLAYETSSTRIMMSISNLLSNVLSVARKMAGVEEASVWCHDFHSWLPKSEMPAISYVGYYPDRSNIAMRRYLHNFYSNDPESLTPEGAEEARLFIEHNYSSDTPF